MKKYPFIISIPHCSERIPKEIKSNLVLSSEEIQESTDRGVSEIFGSLPAKRIISAKWNRLVVDLNRSPTRRGAKGVVTQLDYHGRSIYKSECIPDEHDIERRLSVYYWSFHKRLSDSLNDTDIKALFDCHSLNGTGPEEAPDPGERRNDIVLGNHGDDSGNMIPAGGSITCPPETLQLIKKAFTKAGFSVSLNDPYPGGFITAYHGKELTDLGKIAVQIEINQDLYLEGTPKRLSPIRLEKVKARVSQVFKEMASKL
jgi:N-formylglutamate deformylase